MRAEQSNPKIRSRYKGLTGPGGNFCGKIRLMEGDLEKPLRVRKPAFWAVWNDLFHEDVPGEFVDRVQLIKLLCPQHTFLTLTKRPDRMAEYYARGWYRRVVNLDWFDQLSRARLDKADDAMQRAMGRSFGNITCGSHGSRFLANDWLGTTCENQAMADKRIPHLLECPATMRFLSCEPLLGPIDLTRRWEMKSDAVVRQVIIGCESGPKRRPCKLEWVRDIVDQCAADRSPPAMFIKQLDLDGRVSKDPTDWPAWAKRREFPEKREEFQS